MDVVLQTHSNEQYLALLNVERFGDGSGFCSQLVVRSHGFAGQQQFCPEVEAFREFMEDVERMDRDLRGAGCLQSCYEPEFVELELTRAGSLWVRGELRGFADEPQSLKFAFRTDQTCLRPLANSLRACFDLAPALQLPSDLK
jgi:hypothetical protein